MEGFAVAWVWLALGCLAWIASAVLSLRNLLAITVLEDVDHPAPTKWPRLSVIVPACNEVDTLEAASASLRAEDYPELEIWLVDDRSTDGTTALVDRIAALDERVRALHIQELPDGWLGKTHALHVASRHARGEWFLFTDADVHFAPGVLRRAMAWAEAQHLDHLTLLPRFSVSTFWTEVGVSTFGGLFLTLGRAAAIGKPGSDAYLGVGAFNLVRREALERTEGFAWLPLEIADDTGLAMLLQRNGAKPAIGISRRDLWIQWYATLPGMIHGLEKNAFAVMGHFSLVRTTALIVAMVTNALAAPLALLFGPLWLQGLALLAFLALLTQAVMTSRRIGFAVLPQLLAPFGYLIMAWTLAKSARVTLRQRGVRWRGTLYPLAALKAGQRVKF